jgi:hypothetical protein
LDQALDAAGLLHASTAEERLQVRLGAVVVELTAPAAVAAFVRSRHEVTDGAEVQARSRLHLGAPVLHGRQVSRRLWRGEDGSFTSISFPHHAGVGVRFTPGDPPAVDTWYSQSVAHQLYRRMVAGVSRVGLLETLTAYALLYPALLAAEARGRFPLHAAAVLDDGEAVLLAGAPGSGKSTLVAALHVGGRQILSDNLILVAADGVWSFPEPIKLDGTSRALSGSGDQAGEEATYGRSIERLQPPPGPFRARSVVLVEQGEPAACEALSPGTAEDLLDLNRLALELHTYYLYRAIARLAMPASGEFAGIEEALAGAAWTRLVVAPNDVRSAVSALDARLVGTSV